MNVSRTSDCEPKGKAVHCSAGARIKSCILAFYSMILKEQLCVLGVVKNLDVSDLLFLVDILLWEMLNTY